MNPSEQKNHKTATDLLSRRLSEFSDAVGDRFDRLDQRIHDERTHIEEQRMYVDAAIDQLSARIEELRHRGFWARLNWLVTGR